jgi:hypothetical protein
MIRRMGSARSRMSEPRQVGTVPAAEAEQVHRGPHLDAERPNPFDGAGVVVDHGLGERRIAARVHPPHHIERRGRPDELGVLRGAADGPALLHDDRRAATLERPRGCRQTGHASPNDQQIDP